MVTETMKEGRLFPWDLNQTSVEIQRSVTISHEEVWPIASVSSADISSNQTKIQRVVSLIPVGSETGGRVYFQYFKPTL